MVSLKHKNIHVLKKKSRNPGSLRSSTMCCLHLCLLSHLWSQDDNGSSRPRVISSVGSKEFSTSCLLSLTSDHCSHLAFPVVQLLVSTWILVFFLAPWIPVWIIFLAFHISFSQDTAFDHSLLLGLRHCSSWTSDFLPVTLNLGARGIIIP